MNVCVPTVCYCVREYFFTAPDLSEVFLDTTWIPPGKPCLPLRAAMFQVTLRSQGPLPQACSQESFIIKRVIVIVPCDTSFSSKQAAGKVEGLERGGGEQTRAYDFD